MQWYIATSLARNVLPRCPFATADRCPRYYMSALIIGRSGRSTEMDGDENKRLFEKWKTTDLWPLFDEDTPSSSGGQTMNLFKNMCPEVAYDRFGWFADHLIDYHDETDRERGWKRLAAQLAAKHNVEKEFINIDTHPDWRWGWESLSPLHYTECPLYSPLTSGISEIAGERKRPIGFNVITGTVGDATE